MFVCHTKIEPLSDLFERLNLLNGLLLHLQSQLKMSKSFIERSIKGNNIEVSSLYAGFSLIIRDLTLLPGKEFIHGYYPIGKFISQGEEYLKVIDLLLSREASWVISQAYEAFETFLLDLYAYYLLANPHAVDPKTFFKVKANLAKHHRKDDKLEYWTQFTRLARYDCLKVLEITRTLSPDLQEIEKRNIYQIDLAQWSEVVAEVRHAVTHSNMVIKAERTQAWSPEKFHILHSYFPGNTFTKGYELCIKVEDAETNLRLFGGYSYILYKLLNGISGEIGDILK